MGSENEEMGGKQHDVENNTGGGRGEIFTLRDVLAYR